MAVHWASTSQRRAKRFALGTKIACGVNASRETPTRRPIGYAATARRAQTQVSQTKAMPLRARAVPKRRARPVRAKIAVATPQAIATTAALAIVCSMEAVSRAQQANFPHSKILMRVKIALRENTRASKSRQSAKFAPPVALAAGTRQRTHIARIVARASTNLRRARRPARIASAASFSPTLALTCVSGAMKMAAEVSAAQGQQSACRAPAA